MNIALFSDTFPPQINGVSSSTYTLFQTLKAHGHNVYVITTTGAKGDDEFSFKDNIIRIPGVYLKKLYGFRMSWIYNSKAMNIIRTLNLEIIHIQTDPGIALFGRIVASTLKIPTIYTYHTMYEDYVGFATHGHFERFTRFVTRKYSKTILKNSTEFISPSLKTKDYIRHIMGLDKYVNIIPTGIDFNKFNTNLNKQEDIDAFKEKFGIKKDEFVIMYLGRIAGTKSIDVIIRGYNDFLVKFGKKYKTKLVLVGGGPEIVSLKALVSELKIDNNVVFVGPVDPSTVPFYYSCCNIFTSASITETQGLTFMEAMASHRLVLARFDKSLVGVIESGENGVFFSNEQDFALKLKSIMDMPKKELNLLEENAIKSIDGYSTDVFYKNILGVYNRAIRKSW